MKFSKLLTVRRRWRDNEDGSVIVVALLLMFLLSIVVVAGSQNSGVGTKIAANSKVTARNFFMADALVTQAAKILENYRTNNPEVLGNPTAAARPAELVRQVTISDGGETVTVNADDWAGGSVYDWAEVGDMTIVATWLNAAAFPDGNPRAGTDQFEYLIIDKGVVEGGSLEMTSSRVYGYNIRGRVRSGNSQEEITIGYRIRVGG